MSVDVIQPGANNHYVWLTEDSDVTYSNIPVYGIPRHLRNDVVVWAHEFTEETINYLLSPPLYARRLAHFITSLVLPSGRSAGGRLYRLSPQDFARRFFRSQKKLTRFIK